MSELPDPDLDAAFQFLSALEPEPNVFTHEFCWFAQYGKDGPISQFYGALDESTIERLTWLNKAYRNVFVCVNAIDVPAYDGDYPKRRKSDVTRVRSVFGDFDDPTKPLPQFALPPSLLVQTSPGKHHAYWLTRDTPTEIFEPIQQTIVSKYGSDKAVCDLSRVMRVPGFLHMKDPLNPTMVALLDAPGHVYGCAELMAEFPAASAPVRRSGPVVPRAPLNAFAEAALAVAQENGRESSPGKFEIECPWADEHTTGRGGAVYFAPSSSNGGRGGFKCQHAHCAHRNIDHFTQFAFDLCREEK